MTPDGAQEQAPQDKESALTTGPRPTRAMARLSRCAAWAAGLVLAMPLAHGESPTPGGEIARSYWKARAELPAHRAAALPSWCRGAYVEPDYPEPRDVDSSRFPVRATASRARHRSGAGTELFGDVVLSQGNRLLQGPRAVLHRDSGRIELPDGGILSEPGITLTSVRADIETGARQAQLSDVKFLLFDTEFRGTAHAVERHDDAWSFSDARITRCGPDSRAWEIAATHLAVEEDAGFARARSAKVRVRGVPVFYAPRLRIPLSAERQSGFLFPSAGTSRDAGVRLELPYYLNLAPNYDATVTAHHASKRGTGAELEARHLSRFARTEATGAFLAGDRQYDGRFDRDDFRDLGLPGRFEPADRWLLGLDHLGQIGAATTRIDAVAASDDDYFRDLGTGLAVTSRAYLTRFAEARYARGGLTAGISGLGFQMLEERREPYRRLPEIDVSYAGARAGPFEWSLATVWTAFDHPESGKVPIPGGRRLHVEPRMRLPMQRSWGFLNVGAGYRYTGYDLDDALIRIDGTPERGIAFGDIDAGLFFERDAAIGGRTLIQTLEPRIHYLRQQFADQADLPRFDASEPSFSIPQLFRRNRFSGLDRIGDANRVAVGLTSRLLHADTGREYVRASVGTIAHFEDRRVTLRGRPTDAEQHETSPVVAEFASRAGRFSATAGITWDPADAEEDEVGVAVQYRRDNRRIVNIGHRKRRLSRIDQSDVSFVWPLGGRVAALGKWNYDFERERTNEALLGFEYADCCWQVRLLYHRHVEPRSLYTVTEADDDEGILLQFVFRGLAGFGAGVERVLAQGIKGYREEAGW